MRNLLAGRPRLRIDPRKPPRFHGGRVLGLDSLDLVWDAWAGQANLQGGKVRWLN